jgi:threonine synthase
MYSVSVSNEQHYETIKSVYDAYGVVLEPHGSVGWKALESFNGGNHREPSVVYETADPGKFPDDIQKAIGITPVIPEDIKNQQHLEERIYSVDSPSFLDGKGNKRLDERQYREAREQIAAISGLHD